MKFIRIFLISKILIYIYSVGSSSTTSGAISITSEMMGAAGADGGIMSFTMNDNTTFHFSGCGYLRRQYPQDEY